MDEQQQSRSDDEALNYARSLAVALHRKHFSHVENWKPLDDVVGLLTQIDNMTAGLSAVSERPRWIPIGEYRPVVERLEVLTVGSTGVVATRGAGWVRQLYAEAVENNETCAITHWMPLPDAPPNERPDLAKEPK